MISSMQKSNFKEEEIHAKLVTANLELVFQNGEKEKRAAELFLQSWQELRLGAPLRIPANQKCKQCPTIFWVLKF